MRNFAQAGARRIEFVKFRLRANEGKECQRESFERTRETADGEQRTACEPLHDEERRAQCVMVGLEGVGTRHRIMRREQAIDRRVLPRAFGVGGRALVEAQHHRLADRDGGEGFRRRSECEFEDRRLPSAGKNAEARNRCVEISREALLNIARVEH